MPFDPALPEANSPNSSAEMRGQLQSLKALIDAVVSVQSAVIDEVTTLPPGDAATVSASVTGGVLHLSFGLPQGAEGPPGGGLTPAELEAAISGTASNCNAVGTLGLSVSEPVSQYEGQQIVQKLDDLIQALYRA